LLLRLSDLEVRKAFSTNQPNHPRLVPQKNYKTIRPARALFVV